mmetsp:Transcript_40236/g.113944  ORF Transcript_40236/g.113944 Transcript_40236/m.113944 type:complete len:106 (-) Transcript_40236:202-519(-)|eukprot:CAMPEP_0117692526 /NCGR_PEP_ID=MMETSP0804-20121206/26377_1 /TAXON_ID=1074897 /ORGANISM="Tetraselmis astigmatica, Strain CCMP880" /LENGTH=105 /DNA_ID=CAMNT_0005505985 /DNA_START=536 /DNA_END=853 /DNA_ORIENTATION=-
MSYGPPWAQAAREVASSSRSVRSRRVPLLKADLSSGLPKRHPSEFRAETIAHRRFITLDLGLSQSIPSGWAPSCKCIDQTPSVPTAYSLACISSGNNSNSKKKNR